MAWSGFSLGPLHQLPAVHGFLSCQENSLEGLHQGRLLQPSLAFHTNKHMGKGSSQGRPPKPSGWVERASLVGGWWWMGRSSPTPFLHQDAPHQALYASSAPGTSEPATLRTCSDAGPLPKFRSHPSTWWVILLCNLIPLALGKDYSKSERQRNEGEENCSLAHIAFLQRPLALFIWSRGSRFW